MSLRARLFTLVLLAIMLPALLLSLRFYSDSDAEVAAAVKNLATAAANVTASLDDRVRSTAQLHFGLAHSRVLDDTDRATCSAFLSKVRETYPQYTGILTVRPDGRLHCDSLNTGRELDLNDRSYFKRAKAGESGLILDAVFGRLTGNSVLQVVYPARRDGDALRFVLVASLNLQKFADEVQGRVLLGAPEVLLLDRSGQVMATAGPLIGLPKPGQNLGDSALGSFVQTHREGGVGEVPGPDGQAQVWAVATSATLQSAGLRVLLGLPREMLVADAKLRLRQGLLILGGAALLLFLGVWTLAEWGIRRQVGRITALVQALGAGRLDARIAAPHPRGELGDLMQVLNGTAESLQRQRDAIDDLGQRLQLAHARELAERADNETRLARMANFDGLTGLPNRTLFRDRLQRAMVRSQRSGRPFALMLLDIDRFKVVNDSLGHEMGDRLLIAVAGVLAGCVRSTDSIGVRVVDEPDVFRLGGDEFTILAEEPGDTAAITQLAQRILHALNRPLIVGEHELFASASIGIAVYTRDQTDLDGLIKQADMAMYRAKELGRDMFCFFDEQMHRQALARHQTETRLRHALERREFVLHYQPKADFASGRITGVEALLRWHPEGGTLTWPDQFIPILEETGLIVPVGAWVFQEACTQMMRWAAAGMPPLSLAVNLSARQLRQGDLVQHIAEVTRATGFDPHRLEVEFTESILIDASEAVVGVMQGLVDIGVRMAIDDFGTGESSLNYIKRFSVHTLKIDRSFVRELPGDAKSRAITSAVVALGHGLALTVVAEGVETTEQAASLREQGCDELQGYLLTRPLDADAFAAWLAQHGAGDAAAAHAAA